MPSIQISTLGQSNLIGGDAGQRFNDLEKAMKNDQLMLDENQPIKQIRCRGGWAVDGLEVTYKLSDGSSIKCQHGGRVEGGETIDLSASERVISVFGREGYQDYYKRKLINSIGFVIFDRSTCKSRVVGPIGNGNGSNNGEPFNTSEVISFGGYAQDIQNLGLSGLLFFQKPGGSQYLHPVQLPELPIRSGTFNSNEVRDWFNPQPDSKMMIKLEPPYVQGSRPLIVFGVNCIDVDHNFNVRCRGVVEQTGSTANREFLANIQSWSDTKLYAGGIGWLDVPLGYGIQGGVVPLQGTYRQGSSEPCIVGNIRFDPQFRQAPKILCWLNGLDMDKSKNWRLKTYATEVSENGFNLNVQTWSDSILYGAGASWCAIPAETQDVVIGRFSGNTNSQTGQVSFPRPFQNPPRVSVALCGLDMGKDQNMRIKVEVESVTKEGFKYKLSTWSDSVMHWGEAEYIALAN